MCFQTKLIPLKKKGTVSVVGSSSPCAYFCTHAVAGESLPSAGHRWSQTIWLFISGIWPEGGDESEDSLSLHHSQVA